MFKKKISCFNPLAGTAGSGPLAVRVRLALTAGLVLNGGVDLLLDDRVLVDVVADRGVRGGALTSGTTATVSYLRKEGHQKVLYLANVGDSKAVLMTPNGSEQLSYEHKGTDYGEIDRIVSGGGILIRGRVAGQLAVTRALGDHHLKTSGVSNVPHISRKIITPNDVCLVMASDGIWDVIDSSTLKSNKGRSSLDISNELIQRAVSTGSQDNICVLTVCF